MCGIAGVISIDSSLVSINRLKGMTDAVAHRGPEGESFYINYSGCAGLGHRRLSIVDASPSAAQPMAYLDRYTIVFNGEIYNYLELRTILKKIGYTFQSAGDTEVILAAFAHYGESCVNHFDGMFAFGIWDEKEQSLFCARDRFGEKPFYYYFDEVSGTFYFASEMKALRAAGLEYQPNNELLLQYLALGYTSDPADGAVTFDGRFKKLPAAHCLLFRLHSKKITITRYWQLSKKSHPGITDGQTIDRFNELFSQSISRRLRSDVALGTSLSGGLDSSAIAVRMMQLLPGKVLKTFTASFPGFALDESVFVSALKAAHPEMENCTVRPNGEEFVNDFERLVYHQEEPFSSASVYAQYRVYELARQKHVTVILDGQGADEILAGYYKYIHWFLQEMVRRRGTQTARRELSFFSQNNIKVDWSFKNRVSAVLPRYTSLFLKNREKNKIVNNKWINKEFIHSCYSSLSIHKPIIKTLNDILYYNTIDYGLEDLLRFADRNAMAHGREVRLPFLSHELVSFIFSLPAEMKIRHGWTKWTLRKSIEADLPKEITWRKNKVGFEPPQQQWMQNDSLRDYYHEGLKKLVRENILNRSALDLPLQAHSAYASDNAGWRYLITGALMNNRK